MKPHSLTTARINAPSRDDKFRALGPIAARFGRFPKGAALPETRIQSCPTRRVADFPEGFLKRKWIESLEQNQKLAHCCRHPENMTVAAFKTHPAEPVSDSYEFYCGGVDEMGRRHHAERRAFRILCAGLTDDRPEWK